MVVARQNSLDELINRLINTEVGRPANAVSDDTRRRLVDVAIGQFAETGFSGASTRELAAAAGVNIATLNYHFASKQGLYDATVDEVYRRLRARAGELLAGVSLGDLDVVIERIYRAARLERDGIRVLVREILDHGRLTARTESAHFVPELRSAAKMAAVLLGCSPDQARVAVVAVGYMMSRYVIQDDPSLMTAFAVRSAKQAHERAINTIIATARALLVAAL
jgi:AcrR family transcriptional regulator